MPEVCLPVLRRFFGAFSWIVLALMAQTFIAQDLAAQMAGFPNPYANPYDASQSMRGGEYGGGFDYVAPPRNVQVQPVSADFLRHPLTKRVERKLMAAHRLALAGKHDKAIEDLFNLMAESPSAAPFVYNLLGIEYVAQSRFSEAKQAFEKVLQYMPHISANYSNYALALAQSGDVGSAVSALQKAVALDKYNRPANDLLALIRKAEKESAKLANSGQGTSGE